MLIYRIVNKVNGKLYIGQTTDSLKNRWNSHICRTSHCYALNAALLKYGKENFYIEEIAWYANLDDLNNAEQYYISWHHTLSPNGYNLTTGGDSHKVSSISRERMRKSKQLAVLENRTPWLPRKGERRSPNTEFKKGCHSGKEIQKGQHLSAKTEFKKGMLAPNKGRKRIIDATGKIKFIKVGV